MSSEVEVTQADREVDLAATLAGMLKYPDNCGLAMKVRLAAVRRAIVAEAKVDELEATLGDEEAAHSETLGLWNRARDDRAKLLEQMKEVQDILRDMGWHQDRGVLQRINEVLAEVEKSNAT